MSTDDDSSPSETEATSIRVFECPDEYSDVTFIVEDRKLHFNKTVLSMCSPVFKAMFSADFKEKSAEEIPLPGKKYTSMEDFFKQIHPKYAGAPITDYVMEHVLPLADEYQVEQIHQKSESYIQHQLKGTLSNDRLLFYLRMCDEHTLTRNREILIELAVNRKASDLKKSSIYRSVPSSITSDVMTRRCVKLEKFIYEDVERFRRFCQLNSKTFSSRNCDCSDICKECIGETIKGIAVTVFKKAP